MAVQQNKKSRSARDMRRSHDALPIYRGRKVIDKGADE